MVTKTAEPGSAAGARAKAASVGFDAIAGNMPFLGGRRIATEHGEAYASWLTGTFGGTGGTDYSGYFFLRANELLASRASLGFIATDAIRDGDNRKTTLAPLVSRCGFEPFRAQTGIVWPGNAQVLVAITHLARGQVTVAITTKTLDGKPVVAINSRLKAGPERADPEPLPENAGCALVGCFLRGDGFVLSRSEAESLLAAHPTEHEVVRPFLVGDDINNRPDQSPSRFVIAFGDMTLDETRRFPAALRLVEERVRPQRAQLKSSGTDADHKKHWWRFANTRKELRERLAGASRVLVTARVSKHVLFSFVSPDMVPSEQVVVFPLEAYTAFALLQSRAHDAWVRLVAGARGEGIRYSATECFDTFPFPLLDPRATLPELERLGRELHEARGTYLRTSGIGLTTLYNRLRDPANGDGELERLRALHEQIDRAVLHAYEVTDVVVPPYCPRSAQDHDRAEAFTEAVLDRLFQLNESRRTPAPVMGPSVKRAKRGGPGVARSRESAPGRRRAPKARSGHG